MAKESSMSQAAEVRAHIFKGKTSSDGIMEHLLNPPGAKDGQLAPPPIPPERLNIIYELSAHLQPNISAYITNIHSRGQTFAPVVDFHNPDAALRVADAMYLDRLLSAEAAGEDLSKVKPPEEDEVAANLNKLQLEARVQHARATSFFSSCNPDGSFTDLREKMALDLENTGNAYWEVLRNKRNLPRTLSRLRSAEIRIGKRPFKDVIVTEKRWLTDLTWEDVKVKRQFKRFAQIDEQGKPVVWFKEFGDPRIMSHKTGKYYSSVEAMIAKEKKASKPATELFHFKICAANDTDYGVPRWSGNIPGVLGSRELDETNLDYFLNNAVPALALLVSGGRFAKGVEERLKEFFEEEVRGRRATHKMVVLEAETQRRGPDSAGANPKIEFVPLRNAQVNDALFQTYDSNNASKVRTSFRLPASVTGEARFVLAELRFAEEQVFAPLRDDFDALMNKFFMPALKVTRWKFESHATMVRDPELVGRITMQGVKEGVIVPDEGRRILSGILKEALPAMNKVWSQQPLPLTMAVLGVKAGPAEAVREQGRQAGDPSPMEQLLQELGLGSMGDLGVDIQARMEGFGDLEPDQKRALLIDALGALPSLGGDGDE